MRFVILKGFSRAYEPGNVFLILDPHSLQTQPEMLIQAEMESKGSDLDILKRAFCLFPLINISASMITLAIWSSFSKQSSLEKQ